MLLIHMEASFLFVVASQVEQWRVKWKSIQLLSHARPPLHCVSRSSNKFSSRPLSTWETNNAAQSPYKSESVPLENSIELLSRPVYKSG